MVDEPKNARVFSLRLTFKERQKLDDAAGPMPIGAYIREKLFDAPDLRARNFRRPVENEELLRSILSEIGRTRLSSNLNQIAKACHKGRFTASEDTEEQIERAARRLETIQAVLFDTLGLKPPGDLS